MKSNMAVTFVEFGLGWKWSSGQKPGQGKIIDHKVSHEWIYACAQRDKQKGGKLYKKLRYGRRKYSRGSRAKCIILQNRVGLEYRLAIVDTKKRFGDREADAVLGKQGIGAIFSLVERKVSYV